jgi:hypothetical protein
MDGLQLTEPRQVMAVLRFTGPPGQEDRAMEAWAYYFLRGVGEAPRVTSYENGIYTVAGFIQTTHPGDHDVTDFSPVASLDFCLGPKRVEHLKSLYGRGPKFDGRA